MTEIWKQSRMDAGYEVSNMGRVRSKGRMVAQKACSRASKYECFLPGRVLKPFISKATGYFQVSLSGKDRQSVHRLVAMEFCEGYEEGLVVNHLNGIRTDNRATNLEWTTQQGNNLHAFRELGRRPASLGAFGGEHPTSKAVIGTDLITGEQFYYASAMDAVREGFDSGGISHCCAGRMKTHKGRTWRKAEQWEVAA